MTDFPSKRATLTTEEAREATSLLRAAGLDRDLSTIAGGNRSIRNRVIKDFDLHAIEPVSPQTSAFRRIAGIKSSLESAAPQARPSRPESF